MSIGMEGDGPNPRVYSKADYDALAAECERLRAEIHDLRTTMMAAAVEIQEHWQAHCDEEGYGPANLMHRLERGIAAQYGYDAETVVRLESERDAALAELAALKPFCEYCGGNDEFPQDHCMDCTRPADDAGALKGGQEPVGIPQTEAEGLCESFRLNSTIIPAGNPKVEDVLWNALMSCRSCIISNGTATDKEMALKDIAEAVEFREMKSTSLADIMEDWEKWEEGDICVVVSAGARDPFKVGEKVTLLQSANCAPYCMSKSHPMWAMTTDELKWYSRPPKD